MTRRKIRSDNVDVPSIYLQNRSIQTNLRTYFWLVKIHIYLVTAGKISWQLNVGMNEYKICLKHIHNSYDHIKMLTNKSVKALHSIQSDHTTNFNDTKILQIGFDSYKERLTIESPYIWTNPNNINRRDRLQLAALCQIKINERIWTPYSI